MKVGTDSLLLGSWCDPQGAESILDIGTGSGLLSLMMAQKSDTGCRITALELDELAAQQAQENVAASPWPDKITVFNEDFLFWKEKAAQQFPLIISNPPWFEFAPSAAHNAKNQQRDVARTKARQQHSLTLFALFNGVSRLLSDSGSFYFVLPKNAEDEVMSLITQLHFVVVAKIEVKATPKKAPYCQLWYLKKQSGQCLTPENSTEECVSELIVRDENGNYSEAYKTLCKPFYLNF